VIPAAAALAASLVSALTGAAGIADCAKESGESAAAFVRHNFDTRAITLYDQTHVTVAVSHSECLAHNAVNRVLVFARTPGGSYRLVLDDYGFTDNVEASIDGTVTLASHETVEIIDEATYVWNGTKYVISPERSHRYDVAIEEDRPYVTRVTFAPGASSATLAGTIAGGFGDDYEFDALAGQRVTLQILMGSSKDLRFDVYQDRPGNQGMRNLTTLDASRTWNAILPTGGTWKVSVYGVSSMDHTTKVPYSLLLTIRSARSTAAL
jgi:hypothetical protein